MNCPACGVEVFAEAVFCHKCGQRLVDPGQTDAAEVPTTSPGATALTDAAARQAVAPNEPERILWQGGYSPRAMFGHWIVAAVATVVLLVVGAFFVRSGITWTILIAAVLLMWLYNAVMLGYRKLGAAYVISTQRFTHESGILRRTTDRIETLDIDDVTFEQSIFERFFDVGMIRIASSDRTHPVLTLPGIAHVREVANLIDDARRTERRKRGLHIEQI